MRDAEPRVDRLRIGEWAPEAALRFSRDADDRGSVNVESARID